MKIKILTALVVLAVVFAAFSHIGTVGASAKVPEITKKSFVGQTADLSFAFNTPTGHASDYRISVYGDQTGGSGGVTIDFDDDLRHHQIQTQIEGDQNAFIVKRTFVLHTAASSVITFATADSQIAGPSTFNLYFTIEEL